MSNLKPNQFLLDGHLITEHPILYQREMVRANLDLRKTMTRRTRGLDLINENPSDWSLCWVGDTLIEKKQPKVFGAMFQHKISLDKIYFSKSPYGKPGDLLWVKETWNPSINPHHIAYYKASHVICPSETKWKPSIHMPKRAARIWVMIENIRVERIQEISEEDALCEGVRIDKPSRFAGDAYVAFLNLWESINGLDSWLSNPWVWVVKYRILARGGRPTNKAIYDAYNEVVNRKEASHVG